MARTWSEPDSIRSAIPQPCMGPRRRALSTSMSRVPWSRPAGSLSTGVRATVPSFRASKGRWLREGRNSRSAEATTDVQRGAPEGAALEPLGFGDRVFELLDPHIHLVIA